MKTILFNNYAPIFIFFLFLGKPEQIKRTHCLYELTSDYSPNQRIIGIWQLENSTTNKLEFTSNGIINRYINNSIELTGTYEVTSNCGENSSSTELFLKETDADGEIYCSSIQAGVYADNEDVLTLLGDTGKILVYIRQ